MKEWAGGTFSNPLFAKLQFCPYHFLQNVAKIVCGTHLNTEKLIKALIPFNIIHKVFLHMIHFVVEWLDSLLSDLMTQYNKYAAAYLTA